jgi:hypothetical protein
MPAPSVNLLINVNRDLLNQRMAKYARELEVEPAQFVRGQVGILMRELATAAAPKSKSALENRIDKDIGHVYAPLPKKMLPMAHRSGKGFVWIMASPRQLTGVRERNYHPNDTVADLQRLFHKTQNSGVIRGNKYLPLDWKKRKRGGQVVQELNRIVVKRGVLNQFRIWLKKRAGILGGSWAVAWNAILPKGKTPPIYKFKHVQDGTARGAYIDGLGIPGKATFTLINRAAGVEQPSQLKMLAGVLKHRAEAMKADAKNMLRGAYTRAGFNSKRNN